MPYPVLPSSAPCRADFAAAGGVLRLSVLPGGILRLRYAAGGKFPDYAAFGILEPLPPEEEMAVSSGPEGHVLHAGGLEITLSDRLTVRCLATGLAVSTPADFLSFDGTETTLALRLEEGEAVYGLGQDPMANLNQRDHQRRMFNQFGSNARSGSNGIPLMLSSRGHGVFLHSPHPARFDIGRAVPGLEDWKGNAMVPSPWAAEVAGDTRPDTVSVVNRHPDIDLFLICRDHPYRSLAGYHELTGFAPLLPLWGYGFIQSKNRYHSQEELLALGREFRRRGLPGDVLVVDWLWFTEFGDLQWDSDCWPDPAALFRALREEGFRVVMAQHPFISEKSVNYRFFEEHGCLNRVPPGKRVTYDHSSPEARRLWWEKVRPLVQQGMAGYWTDMGELEEHADGTESFLGSRDDTHNTYMLNWARSLYEGQAASDNTRPYILARSVSAGTQKYGLTLWSGDVDSSWEVLRTQVKVGQGVCLSGQPYWTTDVGGFLTGNELTAELYIRWFEWGVFCPVFRTHGTRPGNEPWSFGPEAEAILARYLRLRYRLLPYIYAMAWENHRTGVPMMRPLALEYPGDPQAAAWEDEYLFGPSLLVAPVTQDGARRREVYLPAGVWYDFWTGRRLFGGRVITAMAPLSRIPLYVKEGALLPLLGRDILHTGEYAGAPVVLHAYGRVPSSVTLYEDDGLTLDYQEGAFRTARVSYRPEEGRLAVEADEGWQAPLSLAVHEGDAASAMEEEPAAASAVLENDGRLRIVLTVCAPDGTPVRATASVGQGYTLRPSDQSGHDAHTYWVSQLHAEDTQQAVCRQGGAVLSWEAFPCAEWLPLVMRGEVTAEIAGRPVTLPLRWGSGLLTRFSHAGSFENRDNAAGPDAGYPDALGADAPFASLRGETKPWVRDPGFAFNMYGYVDNRRRDCYMGEDESFSGVVYSRCTLWLPQETAVRFYTRHEGGLQIWAGRECLYTAERADSFRETAEIRLPAGETRLLVKNWVWGEKPYSANEFGFFLGIDAPGRDASVRPEEASAAASWRQPAPALPAGLLVMP